LAYLSSHCLVKKLTSILLLLCLFLVLFGYHLVFYFQVAAAKTEMMAFLKNQEGHKDVVQFCFDNSEAKQLVWEEEHEFRFNGEMYDVVEKEQKDGRLIIRCIADTKETTLIKDYLRNNRRRNSTAFIQLITIPFVLSFEHAINPPQKIISKNFFEPSYLLTDRSPLILVPPPDVC